MKIEKKPLVIQKFSEGMTWREVAEACDLSLSTIWLWAENDPEFKAAIKAAGESADSEVEAVTFRNACDPDPANNTLRMFWLKSRKGYRDRLDVTTDGGPLAYVDRAHNPRDRVIAHANGNRHTGNGVAP